jgi:pimeloyl-ACP methyl ester carboxylesterase
MEEAISFYNRSGQKLYGIVHVPEIMRNGKNRVGVNLLNPGVKYRVAPNRLNVKIARQLCENGYYVLRFDPAGIGDSEGELSENVPVPDIWEQIQTGLFIEDTIYSNNFFWENFNLTKLILAGSCGGAITALLAGAKDTRVAGLVLADVPVNLRTAKTTFADRAVLGGKKADWLFGEYIKRIFSFEAWIRLITLKTEFRALLKIAFLKADKLIAKISVGSVLPEEIDDLCSEKKLNKMFFESFESVIKRGNSILFVLAENDPGIEIFQHYFQNIFLEKEKSIKNIKNMYNIIVVKNANHVYSLKEWQNELISVVTNWLAENN